MKTHSSPMGLVERMRRSVWTLPLAVLAGLALFGINEAAYESSTQALVLLGERGQARAQIQLLWRALVDAETGQRGYLISGQPEHLRSYQQAVSTARASLEWLSRYYAGSPKAEAVFAAMADHGLGKLSELSTTLELHASGRNEAWRELMLTDIGREKMDGLRSAAQQLLDIETERVAEERADIFSTLHLGRHGINAMMALSLVALLLFLRRTLAFERTQDDQAATLQAQRDALEAEASRRTSDLTELARHLQNAREDEKSRLARELHDELGALLTAAKLDAARLKRAIGTIAPDVELRLQHLNESINRGIEQKRRIIEELRPSSLSNLGLTAALEILAREFASRSEAQLTTRLEAVALDESAQITAYRLVQEALTNAHKHAAATHISVTLEASDPMPGASGGRGSAHVVVHDDGCGFDPARRRGTSHGLMGMRYRVEAEGGRMELHSSPGGGTRVEAWLPRLARETVAADEAVV